MWIGLKGAMINLDNIIEIIECEDYIALSQGDKEDDIQVKLTSRNDTPVDIYYTMIIQDIKAGKHFLDLSDYLKDETQES